MAQDAELSAGGLDKAGVVKLGDWVVCVSLAGAFIGEDVTGELLLFVKVRETG